MTNKSRIAKIIILALLVQLITALMPGIADEHNVFAGYGEIYSTDSYIAERLNYAFGMYGPGAYFSKNGKACTCHGKGKCVANGSGCNCLRYVSIDGERCDLRAVQCMGYAMYIQQVLFGCNEFSNSSKFKNISGPGKVSASGVKKWFVENADVLHPGTHIRVNYSQHSIVLMSVNYDKGTITYIDNNWVGKCKISEFTTISYSEFASRFKSINYAKVYKNYYSYFEGAPDAATVEKMKAELPKATATPKVKATSTPTPTITPKPANYSIGVYEVITAKGSNLNLRSDTNTTSEIVSKLASGTRVEILDFAYNVYGHHWGLIPSDDGSGWVAMEYLKLVATITPTPTNTPIPADYPPGQYQVHVNNKLNIRESYSTNSIIIGSYPNDTIVDIVNFVKGSTGTDWGQVTLETGEQGWIATSYLTLYAEYTPTPIPTHSVRIPLEIGLLQLSPIPSKPPTPTPTVSPMPTASPVPATSTPSPVPTYTWLENHTGRGNIEYINQNKTLLLIAFICIALEAVLYTAIVRKSNCRWKRRGRIFFSK